MNKIDPRFPRFGSPRRRLQKGAALVAVIIAVIVLAVLGAGVSLATRAWDPLWNPFRPEPEEVVDKMISKMAEVETLNMDMSLSGGTESDRVDLDSKISVSAKEEKAKGDYSFSFTSEKISISGNVEAISLKDEIYIKVNSISLPQSYGDISEFEGKWVKFSPPGQASQQWNIEGLESIYSVKKELKDEKVDKVSSYHYILFLEKDGLKEWIEGLMKEESSNLLTGSLKRQIDKMTEELSALEINVWIGKKDSFLKKVEIEKTFASEEGGGSLEASIRFSEFNQPLLIEAPKEFLSFEEVMLQLLMEGAFSPMPLEPQSMPGY